MAKVIIEVNDNYVDQIESFLGRFKSGYSQSNPLKSSLEYLADNRKAKNKLAKFSDVEIKVDDIDKANAMIQNADKYRDEFLKIAHCYLNAVIHNMTQCEKRALDNTDKRTANAKLRGLNGIKAGLEDKMKKEGIKFKADEKKIKVAKVVLNDTVDDNEAKIINGTIKKSINKSAATILSVLVCAFIIGATAKCTNNANSKPDKNNGSVTQSETKQPEETDFIINSWYEPKTEVQTELVTEPETTKETERLTESETVAVTEPITEPDTEQETENNPFDDIFDGIDTDINEAEDFEGDEEETAIADEDAKLRREDRNYNVVEPTDENQNEQ